MKILTTIWVILIIYCILEASFCAKFEHELWNKKKNKDNEK
jgi:hypothetical protein